MNNKNLELEGSLYIASIVVGVFVVMGLFFWFISQFAVTNINSDHIRKCKIELSLANKPIDEINQICK